MTRNGNVAGSNGSKPWRRKGDTASGAFSTELKHDFAEQLIATAQVIIKVLDLQGRIVRFNPYMEEISGYRLREMQGHDWFTTFLPAHEQHRMRKVFAQMRSRRRG